MKAVVINKYGSTDVLDYTDVDMPQIKDNEVLVKNYAAGVNPIDWQIMKGLVKSFVKIKFPTILGLDIAGEVVEIGKSVTKFKVGDKVFSMLDGHIGAYAEFSAVAEHLLAHKPSNLSFEEAAALPSPANTALQVLRDIAKIKPGDKVLVNGSSGGVGIMAVQLAKSFGAQVTGTCSAGNTEFVKNAGADETIDYKSVDFTKQVKQFDIIFDTVGSSSFKKCKRILSKKGIYVTTMPDLNLMISMLTTMFTSRKAKMVIAKTGGKYLDFVKKQVEEEKLKTFIDKVFPLTEVKEAFELSASKRVRGKLVIKIA